MLDFEFGFNFPDWHRDALCQEHPETDWFPPPDERSLIHQLPSRSVAQARTGAVCALAIPPRRLTRYLTRVVFWTASVNDSTAISLLAELRLGPSSFIGHAFSKFHRAISECV